MGLELHPLGARPGELELLLDLGSVAVGGHLVGDDVLACQRVVGGLVEGPPGAGDALLGVDHHIPDHARARERGERQQRGRRVAAGVGDQRRPADGVAVQLRQPVHGLGHQLRAGVLPVPVLVAVQRAQAVVGAEVDHPHAPLAQGGDRRGGGRVGVGDDRRLHLGHRPVEVELLDHQRHAVAGVEVLQPPALLGAAGDTRELEVGVAPDQVGGERAGEAGGTRDQHPWRAVGAALDGSPSHAARPPAPRPRTRSARAAGPRPRR